MRKARHGVEGSSATTALVLASVGIAAIGAFVSLGQAFDEVVRGHAERHVSTPANPPVLTSSSLAGAFGAARRVVSELASQVAAPSYGARPAAGATGVRAAAQAAGGGEDFVSFALEKLASGEVNLGQVRISAIGNGKSRYFTNRPLSTLNCTECTIALDKRLSGVDFDATADAASLDRFAADNGIEVGTGAMDEALRDSKVVKALTSADDEVPELAALFRGEVTFEELQAQGRATIEKAVEVLRAHDFEANGAVWRGQKPDYSGLDAAQERDLRNAYRRSKYAVDKVRDAVADVEALPHVQLMSRFTAQDYSLQEVAVRLGLDPNNIASFSSPEARQWVQLPVWELDEDFGPTFRGIAKRSRADIDEVRRTIERWNREVQDAAGWDSGEGPENLGKRGALSFVAVDEASGDVFAHVLNVVVPRRDTKVVYGGQGPYVVDSQLGHVYNLDDFFAYTYPNMIYAEFIETGDFIEPLPNPGRYSIRSRKTGERLPIPPRYGHAANLRAGVAAAQQQLYAGAQFLKDIFARLNVK